MATEFRFPAPALFLPLALALLPAQAAELESLAWGIRNRGETQQILIDHFTSGFIAGVAGEDVRIPPPLAGGRPVTVAVLDTGVDASHPALKPILAGPGWNAINGSTDVTDSHGHGTHVSGIIAARPLADGDFRGVSPHARILPVKVVQAGPNAPIRPQDVEPGAGTALTETVAKGLEFAIRNGAEVINLSLAWPASIRSKRVDAAIEAARLKNVLIVSSAGNDNTLASVYPCIYPEVICVGAHGPDGAFSHFSNQGPMVDLLAPGTAILGTWPLSKSPVTFAGAKGYELRNGTSMAAPFVAGAAAELLARGVPPSEVRARLILGSRPTRSESTFRSDLSLATTPAKGKGTKSARGGNLDISGALSLDLKPLILPSRKAPMELEWNGVDTELPLEATLRNEGAGADAVVVRFGTSEIRKDSLASGEELRISTTLSLDRSTEGRMSLPLLISSGNTPASVSTLEISIVRRIRGSALPEGARLRAITEGGTLPLPSEVRSVVGASGTAPEHVLLSPASSDLLLTLIRGNARIGALSLTRRSEDLLAIHKLPGEGYCLIFQERAAGSARPSFVLQYVNPDWSPRTALTLGTEITVLSENFQWTRIGSLNSPLWISLGFTPPKDLPPFDPWNPKRKDLKMPRVFFLDERGELRTVNLGKDRIPLQLLPDGRILTGRGSTYFQTYELIELEQGKVRKTMPLETNEYRMFSGASPGIPVVPLSGNPAQTLLITGPSSPGNLRVTGVGPGAFDEVLVRHSVLDSLRNVPAAFQDDTGPSFFVESNHDLLWFRPASGTLLGTSLNRYSYIPSMIFSKTLFPAISESEKGTRAAAIYTPASVANAGVSEVILADPEQERLRRPAFLRLQADPSECLPIGNLIAATAESPALQTFYCKNGFVEIPLTLKASK